MKAHHGLEFEKCDDELLDIKDHKMSCGLSKVDDLFAKIRLFLKKKLFYIHPLLANLCTNKARNL